MFMAMVKVMVILNERTTNEHFLTLFHFHAARQSEADLHLNVTHPEHYTLLS
jgi:hypothetical protein